MWLLSFGSKAFCASQVKNLISLMDLFCFVHVTKSVKREKDKRINFAFSEDVASVRNVWRKFAIVVMSCRPPNKSKTRSSIDIQPKQIWSDNGHAFCNIYENSFPKFSLAVIWMPRRADKQSAVLIRSLSLNIWANICIIGPLSQQFCRQLNCTRPRLNSITQKKITTFYMRIEFSWSSMYLEAKSLRLITK